MPNDTRKHHRRSIRLKGYDYTQDGAIFVTICSYRRECIFGDISSDEMLLNPLGCIVEEEWERTTSVRPYVTLDSFVVMPNHFHGIIMFSGTDVGTQRAASSNQPPTQSQSQTFASVQPRSLGAIIRAFKSSAARRINLVRDTPSAPVWQSRYYEQIIRNEHMLNTIRQYIEANVAQWKLDHDNPLNSK